MWSDIQAPLAFGVIAACVTSLGLFFVARWADWAQRHASLFGLAAGGMLVTLTLMHIAPEAMARTPRAPGWMLGGYLLGLALNLVVRALPGGQAERAMPRDAITPVIAIALHSLVDGIIYAITFAASFTSGVYAASSLILHEVPEGMIAFAIVQRCGIAMRPALVLAFLAAAATTPFGVLISAPVVAGLGDETIGMLYALSAGLLLFVATGPLLAPVRDAAPLRGLGAIAAGVATGLVLTVSPLHSASHHGDHPHEHSLSAEPRFPPFR